MKKTTLFIILVFAVSSTSFGALNAYLRITGEVQGEIKGSVTQAGREDSIMVIAYDHTLTSPRDATTGLPTGKRQHAPLRVTKEIDKSTPLLMNAWANNEKLTDFELRFWRPSLSGQEVQFYTIKLYNAHIVSIQQEMLNNKVPENMQYLEREHLTFVYERLERIYEDDGITAEDDWLYTQAGVLISDMTGDGMVDLKDLAIFASQWLEPAGK